MDFAETVGLLYYNNQFIGLRIKFAEDYYDASLEELNLT